MTEKREKPRRKSSGRIRIAWVDRGGSYFQERPTLVDYSDSGLCVLLHQRIDLQTLVGIRTLDHAQIGNAVVRNVLQKGLQYRIGMEFPCEMVNATSMF